MLSWYEPVAVCFCRYVLRALLHAFLHEQCAAAYDLLCLCVPELDPTLFISLPSQVMRLVLSVLMQ